MKFNTNQLLGIAMMGAGVACIAYALFPILLHLLVFVIGIILIFRGIGLYGFSFARWQTKAMMWAMQQRR